MTRLPADQLGLDAFIEESPVPRATSSSGLSAFIEETEPAPTPASTIPTLREFTGVPEGFPVTPEDVLGSGHVEAYIGLLRNELNKFPEGSPEREPLAKEAAGLQVDLAEFQSQNRKAAAAGVSRETLNRANSPIGAAEQAMVDTPIAGPFAQIARRAVEGIEEATTTGLSAVSRAGIANLVDPRKIGADQRAATEFTRLIESKGELNDLVGQQTGQVIGDAAQSIPKLIAVAKTGGFPAVLGWIYLESHEKAQQTADIANLTPVQRAAYSNGVAALETGLTFLFGKLGRKMGLESLEEAITPGARAAAQQAVARSGLKEATTTFLKGTGGAGLEYLEERSIAYGRQLADISIGERDKLDHEEAHQAGLTGLVARTGLGVSNTLRRVANKYNTDVQTVVKKTENAAPEVLDGVQAAEDAIAQVDPESAPDVSVKQKVRGTANLRTGEAEAMKFMEDASPEAIDAVINSKTSTEFSKATGINRTKGDFRQGFQENVQRFKDNPAELDQLRQSADLSKQAESKTVEPGKEGRGARNAKQFFENATPESLEAAMQAKNAADFAKATGIKKTSGPFRQAFKDTVELYRQAKQTAVPSSPGQVGANGVVSPNGVQAAPVAPAGVAAVSGVPTTGQTGTVSPNAPAPIGQPISPPINPVVAGPAPTSILSRFGAQWTPSGIPLPPARAVGIGAFTGGVAGFATGGPVGATVGASIGAALPFVTSTLFRNRGLTGSTLIGAMEANVEQLAPGVQPVARRIVQGIKNASDRVITAEKEYHGRFSKFRDDLLSRAGNPLFNRAAVEATQTHQVEVINDRVSAIETKKQALLEGRLPLDTASPELQAWVKDQWALNKEIAQIAEHELTIRQNTPLNRRDARRASLQALDIDDLQQLYSELLPNHKMIADRDQLLNRLSEVRFFTPFPEGKVNNRLPLPTLKDVMRQGSSHWLYDDLTASLSVLNGVDLETTRNALAPYEGVGVRKGLTEIPRIFERFPDALEVDGRRVDLLEQHPYNHSSRVADGASTTFANVKVFGQEITDPNGVSQQSIMRDAAIAVGLDSGLVDTAFDTLSGISLEKGVEPSVNLQNDAVNALANVTKSAALSGAFAPSLVEWMGNMAHYGGTQRAMQAFQAFLPKALQTNNFRDAAIMSERIGAYMQDYADFTWNRTAKLQSLSEIYGKSVLAVTRWAWDSQGKQAAVLGYRIAEDLRTGRGTETDFHMLKELGGYSDTEAQTLVDGEGRVTDYHEVARRFAHRVNVANLTHGFERSALESVPAWKNLMWYSGYNMARARVTEGIVQSAVDASTNYYQNPTRENAVEVTKAAARTSRYIANLTLSGALTIAIRNMLFNLGPIEGLWATWEDLRDDPAKFAASAFRAAALGPVIDSMLWGLDKGGKLDFVGAIPAVQPVMESAHALHALTGDSQHFMYKGLSPIEVGATWVNRTAMPRGIVNGVERVAEIDALAPVMHPVFLGTEDEKLRKAEYSLNKFLKEKDTPPQSFVLSTAPDDVEFRRNMRNFMGELKEEDTPERARNMQQHLFDALKVRGGDVDTGIRSLTSRRLIPRIPTEYQREFRERFPTDYDKLKAHDTVVESWAEYLRSHKSERSGKR